MSPPHPMDLSAVRRMDAHVVHPWESFDIPNIRWAYFILHFVFFNIRRINDAR